MKASDLPWWVWLLFAATFGFISADGLVGIIGKRSAGLAVGTGSSALSGLFTRGFIRSMLLMTSGKKASALRVLW
jgi:hypothetical protein